MVLAAGCTAAVPAATSSRTPSAAAAASGSSGWKKIFSADFDGSAGSGLNSAVWKYDTGRGIFGTGEVEAMTNSTANAHLDGAGNLDMVVLGHGAAGSATSAWTSSRIQTQSSSFEAPAGGEMMVTASIQQPDPASGLGYWPGFWMLAPSGWPKTGEIDIMEDVDAYSRLSGTLHCGNLTQPNPDGTFGPCHEKNGIGSGLRACSGCQQGFHTYSVVVDRRNADAQQIRWYLDGREYFSVSESRIGAAAWNAAVDHGWSILLSVAVGGSYPDTACSCSTPTDLTSSRGTMVVQYVSVFTN
jgi:beta-glucanase (GH16 family)